MLHSVSRKSVLYSATSIKVYDQVIELVTSDMVTNETSDHQFAFVARVNGFLHSQGKTWYEITIPAYMDNMEFTELKCHVLHGETFLSTDLFGQAKLPMLCTSSALTYMQL
jgi:hypothetical protein